MTTNTHHDSELGTEDKTATTLELFFDLVFVFAITQVVYALAHHLTWIGAAQAAILLGIIWWGWAGWTWSTNLVSLEPRSLRFVMLASMACVLLMAHAVPTAFDGDGLWVAIPYLIMTQLGGLMSLTYMRRNGKDLAGILQFVPISALAGGLLIIGAIADAQQEWIWLASLALSVISSVLASNQEWDMFPKHFAERHGLIMIIALGEAIIAVGATLANEDATPPSWRVASYLIIGIAYVMTLYWAYFDRADAIWEHTMAEHSPSEIGRYAVQVYTWTHFPMIIGVVFSAVALEEVFAHPDDHLHTFVNHVFAIAIVCFFGGMAAAGWRSSKVILVERLAAVAASLAIIYGLPDLNGRVVVVAVIALFVIALTAEHARFRAAFAAHSDTAA